MARAVNKKPQQGTKKSDANKAKHQAMKKQKAILLKLSEEVRQKCKEMRTKLRKKKVKDMGDTVEKRREAYEAFYKNLMEIVPTLDSRLKELVEMKWQSVLEGEQDAAAVSSDMTVSSEEVGRLLQDIKVNWKPERFTKHLLAGVCDEGEDLDVEGVTVLSQALNDMST